MVNKLKSLPRLTPYLWALLGSFLVACARPTSGAPLTPSGPPPTEPRPRPTSTVEPTDTPILLTPTPTALPAEITDERGVPMVLVPAGPFTMGLDAETALAECLRFRPAESCDPARLYVLDVQPAHTVTLDAYYIDRYEVTNARYAACVAAGACPSRDVLSEKMTACAATGLCRPSMTGSWTRESYYDDPAFDDYPALYVTQEQAVAYCEWRGARLPTEAEWEKAARGTDGRLYPWGNTFDGSLTNFCDVNCDASLWASRFSADTRWDDGFADTAPVGSLPGDVSPYGVYDMAGNVSERVSDWYDWSYYANSPPENPQGALADIGHGHVVRGSSWRTPAEAITTRGSSTGPADEEFGSLGFRCARSAQPLVATSTPAPLPTPVRAPLVSLGDPPLYRGFNQPRPACTATVTQEVEWLKAMGSNTLAFPVDYVVAEDGSFHPNYSGHEEDAIEWIQAAHAAGLRVYLIPTFFQGGQREPAPLPASRAAEHMAAVEPIVLRWAELAEEYGVELFSPLNEPDHAFSASPQTISDWHQRMLPEIRARYSGLIVANMAFAMDVDYSGFDYIGVKFIDPYSPADIQAKLASVLGYAGRDGVQGVMVVEFGTRTEGGRGGSPGVSEAVQAAHLESVFQLTAGQVAGYFALGPLGRFGVRGRQAEEVIGRWFTGNPDFSVIEEGPAECEW